MNKRFFLLFSLFLLFSISISATVFLPKYYLDDFQPLDNNKINLYKGYLSNISLLKDNFYFSKELHINRKIQPDFETGYIKIQYLINNKFDFTHPYYLTTDQYVKNIFKDKFKSLLSAKVKEILQNSNQASSQGLIKDIVLKIPKYTMPKAVSRFLGGDEAAHLRLDGNQRITFSGESVKTKNKSYNEGLGNKSFSLKMKQDLNLNLNGTIGKKIFVKVSHKTPQKDQIDFSGTDKVDVHYEGLEDEIVKEVRAGDVITNFNSSLGGGISTQGLFGVSSKLKIGNLNLNLVLGKDKTEKNVKTTNINSTTQPTIISSRDFSKSVFYIDNPYDLYEVYTQSDAPENFPEWANNAFKLDDHGKWVIKAPGLLPAENTVIHIFVDDDNATNDQLAVRGKNWSDPADTTTYHFDELVINQDFAYDQYSGLITFFNTINRQSTIGIIYTRADGVQVGDISYDENDPNSFILVKLIKKKNQDSNTDTWIYQCRNIYDLGMRDISPDGFELKVYDLNADNTQNYYFHNGLYYTDFLQLDTNGDKKINGDDVTVELKSGKIIVPMIYPFYALGDSIIYQRDNLTSNDETKMFIYVKGKIKQEQISIGSFNIVKNSVVVKLNNVTLKPNVDYTVDYDLGIITLLNEQAISSFDKITIEYEDIPLFSLKSKTLMAAEGNYKYGDDLLSLNGILAYQSESVKEDRPKIGGENRSIILAGLSANYKLKMPFLTKLVDKLPLINTDSESKLSLQSSFNMSIPHIYGSTKQPNKKEAYLEDMESSLETMGLGVTRRVWVPASKPYQLDFHKADVNWFVLPTWRAGDVYDNLSEQEKKEKIPVMTVKVTPDSLDSGTQFWGGLMKYIGNMVDLSDKDFIELMIKPEEIGSNVTVNIDMGKISEDFYTEYGGEGVLNTEDGKNGGALNGTLDIGEDTGLDGIKNSEEEGYSSDNKDPHHDNFDNKKINNEFPYINRTENNSTLDTEDLNSNGRLDTDNVYFEYSFPLDEITQWFVGNTNTGFKFYRIPLKAFNAILSSTGEQPNLSQIDYIRIWFGVDAKSKFDIAFFNLIGNKWKKSLLRNEDDNTIVSEHDLAPDEDFRVGTTDTQKNPHYVQPKQTVIKTHDKTLEQAVFVDYTNIQENHLALISEKINDFSANNYASSKGISLINYKKLRFLVYAEKSEESEYNDNEYLHLYFRIGTDTLNYYEIRYDSLKVNPYDADIKDGIAKMKRSYWKQFEIEFSDLTKLKSELLTNDQDSTATVGKYKIKIVHQKNQWPTLTNVKMLSFGISPAQESFNGIVYYDDIRVVDAYQEAGFKFNTTFTFNLAGISDVNLSYNSITPNFLNSASRNTNPSLTDSKSLTLTNHWHLGKFFPAEWGISLPLTLSKENRYSVPLYKANSDLSVDKLPAEEKKREVQKSTKFSTSINYKMNKTPRSKILEYTLKKTELYFSYNNVKNNTSVTRDTSKTYSGKIIYNLDIPQESIDIKILKNYRFFFFPKNFSNTFVYTNDDKTKWTYSTVNDTLKWQKDINTYPEKKFETNNSITYQMFSDLGFTYSLQTTRDLNVDNYYKKIPIGIEKSRVQNISSSFSPHYLDKVFTFSLNPSVTYSDNHKKTGIADTLYYLGDVQRNTTVNFNLKNKDLLISFVNWLDKKLSSDKKSDKKDSENKEKKEEKEKKEKKEEYKEENYSFDKNTSYDSYKNEEKKDFKEIEKNDKSSGTKDKYGNKNSYRKDGKGNKNKIKSKNIFVKMLNYLTNISNITSSYTNRYSSSYFQRTKRPEFLYQLGLPNILPDDDISREETDNIINLNTNLNIFSGLTTTWSFKKELKDTKSQTHNYSDLTVFPSIELRFSNASNLLHIEKIITSSNLSSSYQYSINKSGVVGNATPDRIEENYNLNPLISWDANWIKGFKSTLSGSYKFRRNTTNNGATQIIKHDIEKSVNLQIRWSFSAPSGIDLPILRRIHFKNELSPQLDIKWLENKIYNLKDKKHPEKWSSSIEITPKADYKFNRNITGTFSMNYKLNKNFKDNSSMRNFSVSISVQIRF